jgi:hypothetical protein
LSIIPPAPAGQAREPLMDRVQKKMTRRFD